MFKKIINMNNFNFNVNNFNFRNEYFLQLIQKDLQLQCIYTLSCCLYMFFLTLQLLLFLVIFRHCYFSAIDKAISDYIVKKIIYDRYVTFISWTNKDYYTLLLFYIDSLRLCCHIKPGRSQNFSYSRGFPSLHWFLILILANEAFYGWSEKHVKV